MEVIYKREIFVAILTINNTNNNKYTIIKIQIIIKMLNGRNMVVVG